jgi:hypothetical protein
MKTDTLTELFKDQLIDNKLDQDKLIRKIIHLINKDVTSDVIDLIVKLSLMSERVGYYTAKLSLEDYKCALAEYSKKWEKML